MEGALEPKGLEVEPRATRRDAGWLKGSMFLSLQVAETEKWETHEIHQGSL